MTEHQESVPGEGLYDPVPGLRLMRAIAALDEPEIARIRETTESLDLLRSLGSVALSWGLQVHGTHLVDRIDALLLDLSIDPLTQEGPPDA